MNDSMNDSDNKPSLKIETQNIGIDTSTLPQGNFTVTIKEGTSFSDREIKTEVSETLKKKLASASRRISALDLEELLVYASVANGVTIAAPKQQVTLSEAQQGDYRSYCQADSLTEEGSDSLSKYAEAFPARVTYTSIKNESVDFSTIADKKKAAAFCEEIFKRLTSNKITLQERKNTLALLESAEDNTALCKVRDKIKEILILEHKAVDRDINAYIDDASKKFGQLKLSETKKNASPLDINSTDLNPDFSVYHDPKRAESLLKQYHCMKEVQTELNSNNTQTTLEDFTATELFNSRQAATKKYYEYKPVFYENLDSTAEKILKRLSTILLKSGVFALFGAALAAGLGLHSYAKTGDVDYTKYTVRERVGRHLSPELPKPKS